MRTRPLLNSVKQGIHHLVVVDEIHEAEASPLLLPRLVAATVDDSCYTSDHLTLAVSQIIYCIANLERRILRFVQGHHLLLNKAGNMIGISRIEIDVEFDELFQLLFRGHLFYFYAHFY